MKYPFAIEYNLLNTPVDIGYIREVFKDLSDIGFEIEIKKRLELNRWEFVEDTEWGARWKKTFTCMYATTVIANIGYKEEHLDGCWSYGVIWLECEYENSEPHTLTDLKDMYDGMRIALEDLLAIGIPLNPRGDIIKQKEVWNLTNQEMKRNVDLINATRLLEFNYKAVKNTCFKDSDIVKWFNDEKKDRHFDYWWMSEFIEKEVAENGARNKQDL